VVRRRALPGGAAAGAVLRTARAQDGVLDAPCGALHGLVLPGGLRACDDVNGRCNPRGPSRQRRVAAYSAPVMPPPA
jgi:hypothetical protein